MTYVDPRHEAEASETDVSGRSTARTPRISALHEAKPARGLTWPYSSTPALESSVRASPAGRGRSMRSSPSPTAPGSSRASPPARAAARHLYLPVYDRVTDAVEATGADASVVYVPPERAADAMLEAIHAGVKLVVCITEGVPVLDMVRVKRALEGTSTTLIGPRTPPASSSPAPAGSASCRGSSTAAGTLASSRARVPSPTKPRRNAPPSASGRAPSVGIGADPVHGIGFVECLKLFLADDETDGIILIGEIGGAEEEAAAEFLRDARPSKPVVGYVAGHDGPGRQPHGTRRRGSSPAAVAARGRSSTRCAGPGCSSPIPRPRSRGRWRSVAGGLTRGRGPGGPPRGVDAFPGYGS